MKYNQLPDFYDRTKLDRLHHDQVFGLHDVNGGSYSRNDLVARADRLAVHLDVFERGAARRVDDAGGDQGVDGTGCLRGRCSHSGAAVRPRPARAAS